MLCLSAKINEERKLIWPLVETGSTKETNDVLGQKVDFVYTWKSMIFPINMIFCQKNGDVTQKAYRL